MIARCDRSPPLVLHREAEDRACKAGDGLGDLV
jgi:hypothetical protein